MARNAVETLICFPFRYIYATHRSQTHTLIHYTCAYYSSHTHTHKHIIDSHFRILSESSADSMRLSYVYCTVCPYSTILYYCCLVNERLCCISFSPCCMHELHVFICDLCNMKMVPSCQVWPELPVESILLIYFRRVGWPPFEK